jgi:hypothetical protein
MNAFKPFERGCKSNGLGSVYRGGWSAADWQAAFSASVDICRPVPFRGAGSVLRSLQGRLLVLRLLG